MQSESEKECSSTYSPDGYSDFYAFCDILLKQAFEERKYFSIDLYNSQISHIKQLIYLCATGATAISAVIVCTPYWGGNKAMLVGNSFCFSLLIIAFASCILGLFYGVFSLRGEHNGFHPIPVGSYLDLATDAHGDNKSQKVYESKMKLLNELDHCIDFFKNKTTIKAKKIRILNTILMIGIGCAIAGTTALFSITLLENYYVKQRATEICTEKPGVVQNKNTQTKSNTIF